MAARTPFEDTSVSVARSQEQIRTALRDAGALGVQFEEEWGNHGAPTILRVRFAWPMGAHRQVVRLEVTPLEPVPNVRSGWRISPEQRERQAWRGLAWYLDSTLKAATFGLIRFEDIFLSFMEGGDGQTIGEIVLPQLAEGRLLLTETTA